VSKAPLKESVRKGEIAVSDVAYPRPSRESSGVVVYIVVSLKMAHSKHTWLGVESEGPIPNGLTTVAK
jgi:hypothetical protein